MLADVGYADYGPVAKTIEWGIAVHEGRQFGTVNRLVMLAGCVAILLLATTAPVMWWKRRPKGTLAAPPPPPERSVRLGVLAIVTVAGVIFPLVGATLIAALAIDFLWGRIVARRRRTEFAGSRTWGGIGPLRERAGRSSEHILAPTCDCRPARARTRTRTRYSMEMP